MKTKKTAFETPFDRLAWIAGATAALNENPNDLEALKEVEKGVAFLLGKKSGEKPWLSLDEAAEELSAEFAERAAEVSLYLEALVEEGSEVWEERWEETGGDLDWGDQLDGLSLEVEVNSELADLFEDVA